MALPFTAWLFLFPRLPNSSLTLPHERRKHTLYGVRWQAQRDTALDFLRFDSTKAPSPLRSAGALQNVDVLCLAGLMRLR